LILRILPHVFSCKKLRYLGIAVYRRHCVLQCWRSCLYKSHEQLCEADKIRGCGSINKWRPSTGDDHYTPDAAARTQLVTGREYPPSFLWHPFPPESLISVYRPTLFYGVLALYRRHIKDAGRLVLPGQTAELALCGDHWDDLLYVRFAAAL
jgi:hypothetical protein